jgi:hypothetical protein
MGHQELRELREQVAVAGHQAHTEVVVPMDQAALMEVAAQVAKTEQVV